jgi:predicted dienelactone hydrolase
MSLRLIAVLSLALLVALAPAHAAPLAVETILGDWTDAARANRVVPFKIYYPPQAQGARPVVIFSHGLGGNREGAEYLLHFLAESGYVAVAVQHPGSDTPAVFGELSANGGGAADFDRSTLPSKLKDSISPQTAAERFRDIPFAIDQLEAMNTSDAKLRGHLDTARLGMSGHSFGAITTMALAGQSLAGGRFSFADRRIKAAIAYSPSKPRRGDPAEAFATIRIPTFHMTGTQDTTPFDAGQPPENRQIPYRNITGADKFLVVFNGGDHMIFSGRALRSGPRPNDDKFHALIQKASLAYWDAYLMGNKDAKAYLTDGRFKQDLGEMGSFEFRLQ